MKNLIRLALFTTFLFISHHSFAESVETSSHTVPLWGDRPFGRPHYVKGIHLTSWYTGSKKGRRKFEPLFSDTEINTAVIDVKEINGEVYVPGVQWDSDLFTSTVSLQRPYRRAIRDLESYLYYLKERGIYTIARLTVFQDQLLAKEHPELAIQSSTPIPKAVEMGFSPHVWVDWRGLAWADPYQPKVQKYNIDVAERAAQLGFQGIQFDYIRFPSDGDTKYCRYAKTKTTKRGPQVLADFLQKARKRLKPYDVEISIDVFGLVGSYKDDLGIGQKLTDLLDSIDVLSPMMYPSHYAPGEYGLDDPNDYPYETVYRSIKDTLQVLEGTGIQLRPFLQDFSLKGKKVKYREEQVRAQIKAAADLGVNEYMLWNARCRYTKKALIPN